MSESERASVRDREGEEEMVDGGGRVKGRDRRRGTGRGKKSGRDARDRGEKQGVEARIVGEGDGGRAGGDTGRDGAGEQISTCIGTDPSSSYAGACVCVHVCMCVCMCACVCGERK